MLHTPKSINTSKQMVATLCLTILPGSCYCIFTVKVQYVVPSVFPKWKNWADISAITFLSLGLKHLEYETLRIICNTRNYVRTWLGFTSRHDCQYVLPGSSLFITKNSFSHHGIQSFFQYDVFIWVSMTTKLVRLFFLFSLFA